VTAYLTPSWQREAETKAKRQPDADNTARRVARTALARGVLDYILRVRCHPGQQKGRWKLRGPRQGRARDTGKLPPPALPNLTEKIVGAPPASTAAQENLIQLRRHTCGAC